MVYVGNVFAASQVLHTFNARVLFSSAVFSFNVLLYSPSTLLWHPSNVSCPWWFSEVLWCGVESLCTVGADVVFGGTLGTCLLRRKCRTLSTLISFASLFYFFGHLSATLSHLGFKINLLNVFCSRFIFLCAPFFVVASTIPIGCCVWKYFSFYWSISAVFSCPTCLVLFPLHCVLSGVMLWGEFALSSFSSSAVVLLWPLLK